MKIWVLGLRGCQLGYTICYDLFKDGVVEQNKEAELFNLNVLENKVETSKGNFEIVNKYTDFLGLVEKENNNNNEFVDIPSTVGSGELSSII